MTNYVRDMLELKEQWDFNGITAQYYLCGAIDLENCNILSSSDASFPNILPEQIVIQPVFDSVLMPSNFL